ncbi:MAG: hypothetical protein K2P93_01020 [Alphaproteobacteria bacterium]|nr:hypothetical protein [Alphaproteobacteria bacterium]
MFFRFLSSFFTFIVASLLSVTALYSMLDETNSHPIMTTKPWFLDNPKARSRISFILSTFKDNPNYYEEKLYSLLSLGHSEKDTLTNLLIIYKWRLHPSLSSDEFRINFKCLSLKTGLFNPLVMFEEYCKLSVLANPWPIVGRQEAHNLYYF